MKVSDMFFVHTSAAGVNMPTAFQPGGLWASGFYEQGRHRWSKQWTAQIIYCRVNHPEECLWFPSITEVSRANKKPIDQSRKPNIGIRRILLWLSWDAPKSPQHELNKCHRLRSESQKTYCPVLLVSPVLKYRAWNHLFFQKTFAKYLPNAVACPGQWEHSKDKNEWLTM